MLHELQGLGFDIGDSASPVIPLVIGEDMDAYAMTHQLAEEGVFVNPVVTPAVPAGRAMIRTSYMATHTREHLDAALEAFARVGRQIGVLS
jgi:7-keto-8-aminopelargonate synthetase-like enzyme